MIGKFSKVRKRKGKDQWAVYSKKGKKLSRWYDSKKRAESRLGQIEYFKNNAEDQESNLLDFIDHETYNDVLSTKPTDVSNSRFSHRKAFGHIMNSGHNSVQGDQTPYFDEEVSYRFFSGHDDADMPNKSPSVNSKHIDKDLSELEDYLFEEDEIVEARNLLRIIKMAYDPSQPQSYTNFDIAGLIPDMDVDVLTSEPAAKVPFLGNVGDPRSVNTDFLIAKIPFIADAGMAVAERWYKRMNYIKAMETLKQESMGILEGNFDSDEEKSFAAFLYLMHKGYNCKTRVDAYGRKHGSIMKHVNQIFNDQYDDWVIPGLLGLGVGLNVGMTGGDWKQIPAKLLGGGLAAAYGFGGHIMYNLAITKLIPMICNDPMSFKFKDGILIYEQDSPPSSSSISGSSHSHSGSSSSHSSYSAPASASFSYKDNEDVFALISGKDKEEDKEEGKEEDGSVSSLDLGDLEMPEVDLDKESGVELDAETEHGENTNEDYIRYREMGVAEEDFEFLSNYEKKHYK